MMHAIDPLQRRADEIYAADRAEEANLDLQRAYSGLDAENMDADR